MKSALLVQRVAQDELQSRMWTSLPAIVQKFDAASITVSAQPAIQAQVLQPDGTWLDVTISVCEDCPVVFPGCGKFALTFPVAAGDEGLLVIASRCIDSWWQNGGVQKQAELRMHDLSDGFFIPASSMSQPSVLGGVSTDTCQLRSEDGTTYVEVTEGKIVNVVAPDGFEVTGPTTFNGPVTFLGLVNGEGGGSGTVNFGAANLLTTGTSTATDHLSDGISGAGHVHPGVQPGSGDTGTPV